MPQTQIRIDPSLREDLLLWAEEEERSLTNLISWLLRKAVHQKKETQ